MGKNKSQRDPRIKEVVIHYARGKLSTPSDEFTFYYPKGIRWGCKRCGACCMDTAHRPRRILLLSSDVERLEKCGEKEFKTELRGERPFIAEMRKRSGSCIYLIEKDCRVYPNRALLCRTYPFWIEKDGEVFEIMVDPHCTGIGRGGELREDFYRQLLLHAVEQRDIA